MRSVSPRPRLALLLLALLLCAGALPLVHAQDAPSVTLDARVEGGRLALRVDAGGDERPLLVAITHEDPLLGTIVNRIVPLETSADGEVIVDDLRFETDFTIRVLDARLELPLLPNASLLDGAAFDRLPDLARTLVPSLDPATREHTMHVEGHIVATDPEAGTRHLVTTRSGLVAVLGANTTDRERMHWEARVSHDGGHTFTQPVALTPPRANASYWAQVGEVGDDQVLLLHKTWTHQQGQEAQHEPWMLVRFDARNGTVVASEEVGASSGVTFGTGNQDIAFLPDGSALFFFDGQAEQRDEHGEVLRSFSHGTLQLWRIDAEGGVTFVSSIRPPEWHSFYSWRAAVSRTGHVVVAAGITPSGQGVSQEVRVARSADMGRTFTSWQTLPRAHPEGHWAYPERVAVDETGTAHVMLVTHRPLEGGLLTDFNAYHARVPAVGPATLTDLRARTPYPGPMDEYAVTTSHVVTRDGRTWIFWMNSNHMWAAESFDGGLTWGPSTRIREQGNEREIIFAGMRPVDVLPDGRPILLLSGFLGFTGHYRTFSAPLYDPLRVGLLDELRARVNGTVSGSLLRLELLGQPHALVPRGVVDIPVRLHSAADVELRPALRSEGGEGLVYPYLRDGGCVLAPRSSCDTVLRLDSQPAFNASAGAPESILLKLRLDVDGLRPAETRVELRLVAAPVVLEAVPDQPPLDPAGGRLLLRLRNVADAPLGAVTVRAATPSESVSTSTAHLPAMAPHENATLELAVWSHDVDEAMLRLQAAVYGVPLSLPVDVLLRFAPRAPPPAAPEAEPQEPEPAAQLPDAGIPGSAGATAAGEPEVAPPGAETSSTPAETDAGMAAAPSVSPTAPPPAPVVVAGGAAATLTLAAAAVSTGWGRAATGAVAAGLYARISRAQALDHEVRARVYAHVRAQPGVRFESLRKELALSNGAAAHHLRTLQREGFVRASTSWTRRVFHATDRPFAARPSPAHAIAGLLRERPGLGAADIARELGVSRQLAHYHLRALDEAGRVQARREAGRVGYWPAED